MQTTIPTENQEKANPALKVGTTKRGAPIEQNQHLESSTSRQFEQKTESAASAPRTDGAKTTCNDRAHHTNEWFDDQERANWGGCLRYFDGCACNACEAAEQRQNAAFGLKVRS